MQLKPTFFDSRTFLRSIGVDIPAGANSFHTDRENGKPYIWFADLQSAALHGGLGVFQRFPLTEEQIKAMFECGVSGSFGWDLGPLHAGFAEVLPPVDEGAWQANDDGPRFMVWKDEGSSKVVRTEGDKLFRVDHLSDGSFKRGEKTAATLKEVMAGAL